MTKERAPSLRKKTKNKELRSKITQCTSKDAQHLQQNQSWTKSFAQTLRDFLVSNKFKEKKKEPKNKRQISIPMWIR